MKFLMISFFLLFTIVRPAMAAESQASKVSIQELIEITQSKKMFDGVMAQMDGMMKASMQQSLAGQKLTDEHKNILSDMQKKIIALFQSDLKWEVLEPDMIEVYRQSFSQSELDGMLSFYKTEAGKAVIAKMPVVMQGSMQLMQERMKVMMPKLQKIQKEALAEIKASKKKESNKEAGHVKSD